MNESTKPLKRRSVFRFKLNVLLLLFIPVGFASLWAREYYLDRVPIDWQTFSTKPYHQQLHDGRTVLVFQHYDWDVNGVVMLQAVLETPEVRRAIRKKRVLPFLISGEYEEQRKLLSSIGQRSQGTILIVSHPSSPSNPIVNHGLVGKEGVIDLIYATP